MNDETLKANWNDLKGRFKQRWAALTDDELKQAEGKADQLAATIHEKYGVAKEKVIEQINEICESCTPSRTR